MKRRDTVEATNEEESAMRLVAALTAPASVRAYLEDLKEFAVRQTQRDRSQTGLLSPQHELDTLLEATTA